VLTSVASKPRALGLGLEPVPTPFGPLFATPVSARTVPTTGAGFAFPVPTDLGLVGLVVTGQSVLAGPLELGNPSAVTLRR
jgi:hypothetical protein